MVRLRPIVCSGLSTEATSFNPTMVRLRPLASCFLSSDGGQVSIPLWCDCDEAQGPERLRALLEFQSHYGAIATEALPAELGPALQVSIPLWCDCDDLWGPKTEEVNQFQSHYGAIATTSSTRQSLTMPSFNPTMVRLRPERTLSQEVPSPCFNPTMVRLRPGIPFGIVIVPRISIPLWCDCDPPSPTRCWRYKSSFNPTMVRLRLTATQNMCL